MNSLLVSDQALDVLFRKARSFNDFKPQPVTDEDLHKLYELAKWGPTTANSQPQRVLFVRSAEAKEKLAPALSSQNRKKALGAPVVAILAYDDADADARADGRQAVPDRARNDAPPSLRTSGKLTAPIAG
jgi:3-hydroxypropanoate dehydrogenase